ncbi:MAG TPA: hypothetical protein GXX57_07815 [Firmicutes bacterium]|nr:hypothetical protein [Bacillota bacterium]
MKNLRTPLLLFTSLLLTTALLANCIYIPDEVGPGDVPTDLVILTAYDFDGVEDSSNETSAWVYHKTEPALRTATSRGETITATFYGEPAPYHLWVLHGAGEGWGDGSRMTKIQVTIHGQQAFFTAQARERKWTKVGTFQLQGYNVLELAGYNEQNSAFVYGLILTVDENLDPSRLDLNGILFLKDLQSQGLLDAVAPVLDERGMVIGGFNNAAQAELWGFVPVEEPTQNGPYSGKWDHGELGYIKAPAGFPCPIPTDWSPYRYLEFDCYSPAQTDAWWKLNIMSENPDTDGGDYYTIEFRVDWEGWKHFRLRLADLSKSRTPIGWHQIDGIELWNHGWGHERDPDTVIYFNNIRLSFD